MAGQAKLRGLTPMLRTWELDASIAFYRDRLGFSVENASEGWASLSRDGVELMLSAPNEHEGDVSPAFTGSLYFLAADIEQLWTRVREHARVCYPLEDFDYGMREFAIYDNNGYLLQFGEPLEAEE